MSISYGAPLQSSKIVLLLMPLFENVLYTFLLSAAVFYVSYFLLVRKQTSLYGTVLIAELILNHLLPWDEL